MVEPLPTVQKAPFPVRREMHFESFSKAKVFPKGKHKY